MECRSIRHAEPKASTWFLRDSIMLSLPRPPTCKKRLADLCDAFSIGGTKNGVQFGEALVILNDSPKSERIA